ncbi:MAG: hypothetical protein ACD_3C00054G0001 [uncultured bacterium (gcode 4)]|uniref:Uncharacterized protein n=1 Tax=uncultured bacterium (gcode 4) TaxID=1234023 RepID=K2FBF4_9BACT|nr:MAG: hypothetical protein ACD_3C00054G0001 [uncultured bacterium (gcode 4)]
MTIVFEVINVHSATSHWKLNSNWSGTSSAGSTGEKTENESVSNTHIQLVTMQSLTNEKVAWSSSDLYILSSFHSFSIQIDILTVIVAQEKFKGLFSDQILYVRLFIWEYQAMFKVQLLRVRLGGVIIQSQLLEVALIFRLHHLRIIDHELFWLNISTGLFIANNAQVAELQLRYTAQK